MADKVIDLFGK